MTTEDIPVKVNRPFPSFIRNSRFLLKRKKCGDRLIYEVMEKTSKGNVFLGTCRIYWKKQSGKDFVLIAKQWGGNEELEKVLDCITEIVQEQIGKIQTPK